MKNAQLIIKKREDELHLALRVARIGYWRYDCLTQSVEWLHNHELLFGIKREEFGGTLDDVQSLVHPDDREHGIENLRKTLTENVPFDNTYRVLHPNGKMLWLHSYGYLYHDKDGNPDYIFGITQNITERKEKER